MNNQQVAVRAEKIIERPLVTFALFAYNQEQFIKEAVEGALSQTYSPLEIVLSDDCSTDRTFAIMKEVSAAYLGPHTIVLNSNYRNLGVSRHINKVMSMSSGEVVVVAAGDDVSLPQRTDVISTAFASNPSCVAIYSSVLRMDALGNELGVQESVNRTSRHELSRAVLQWCPGVLGASHAWKRKLFDFFGPLNPRIATEDRALPMRAILIGEIHVIDDPLVKYRVHPAGISQMPSYEERTHYFRRHASLWRQGLGVLRGYGQDLKKFEKHAGTSGGVADALRTVQHEKREAYIRWKFYASERDGIRLRLLMQFLTISKDWRQSIRFLLLIVCPRLYLRRLSRLLASR